MGLINQCGIFNAIQHPYICFNLIDYTCFRATIPSSFKLEFFVNNLDKSNSTFERIGL